MTWSATDQHWLKKRRVKAKNIIRLLNIPPLRRKGSIQTTHAQVSTGGTVSQKILFPQTFYQVLNVSLAVLVSLSGCSTRCTQCGVQVPWCGLGSLTSRGAQSSSNGLQFMFPSFSRYYCVGEARPFAFPAPFRGSTTSIHSALSLSLPIPFLRSTLPPKPCRKHS